MAALTSEESGGKNGVTVIRIMLRRKIRRLLRRCCLNIMEIMKTPAEDGWSEGEKLDRLFRLSLLVQACLVLQ